MGECSCKTGYSGEFCQDEGKFVLKANRVLALLGVTSFMWWIIIFALIVAMIALVYMLILKTKVASP